MDGLEHEELKIRIEEVPGQLRVVWTGRSNTRNPSAVLTPFFDGLLRQAARNQVQLTMHFELLEHFNSSTIASVIQLINAAEQGGVSLTLVYDASQRWQVHSFDALRRALKPFESTRQYRVDFIGRNSA